ncbi:hypothetical protein E2C01_086008 [Portunus trituberculatus]|uniref:Uncharacterized protein n=1 Tax=Portunus trituberculatus TaxID=210409 RepID=A0A5B7J2M4_PORTR|nr:hypothetical protein [Portunus trituberculatus]
MMAVIVAVMARPWGRDGRGPVLTNPDGSLRKQTVTSGLDCWQWRRTAFSVPLMLPPAEAVRVSTA